MTILKNTLRALPPLLFPISPDVRNHSLVVNPMCKGFISKDGAKAFRL